ncbi:hypothetical protein CO046_01585 [Candidatus Peregrinibacteria bacterium CG_4_9_14_0_2_um_filter_53_11]|nr:MAG: hypothetical protein CO046_01585 [Candidatus Peregrinibacteria bacterium CG_4_9_14_0_2_um_filter_53_11]
MSFTPSQERQPGVPTAPTTPDRLAAVRADVAQGVAEKREAATRQETREKLGELQENLIQGKLLALKTLVKATPLKWESAEIETDSAFLLFLQTAEGQFRSAPGSLPTKMAAQARTEWMDTLIQSSITNLKEANSILLSLDPKKVQEAWWKTQIEVGSFENWFEKNHPTEFAQWKENPTVDEPDDDGAAPGEDLPEVIDADLPQSPTADPETHEDAETPTEPAAAPTDELEAAQKAQLLAAAKMALEQSNGRLAALKTRLPLAGRTIPYLAELQRLTATPGADEKAVEGGRVALESYISALEGIAQDVEKAPATLSEGKIIQALTDLQQAVDPALVQKELRDAIAEEAKNEQAELESDLSMVGKMRSNAAEMEDGAMKSVLTSLATALSSIGRTLAKIPWLGNFFRGGVVSNAELAKDGDQQAIKAVRMESYMIKFGLPKGLATALGGQTVKDVLTLCRDKKGELTDDTSVYARLDHFADQLEKNAPDRGKKLIEIMGSSGIEFSYRPAYKPAPERIVPPPPVQPTLQPTLQQPVAPASVPLQPAPPQAQPAPQPQAAPQPTPASAPLPPTLPPVST